VVVRQRKAWRRKEGTYIYFEDNAGVIVNPKGEMKGEWAGVEEEAQLGAPGLWRAGVLGRMGASCSRTTAGAAGRLEQPEKVGAAAAQRSMCACTAATARSAAIVQVMLRRAVVWLFQRRIHKLQYACE
jgi:hypothetical protein